MAAPYEDDDGMFDDAAEDATIPDSLKALDTTITAAVPSSQPAHAAENTIVDETCEDADEDDDGSELDVQQTKTVNFNDDFVDSDTELEREDLTIEAIKDESLFPSLGAAVAAALEDQESTSNDDQITSPSTQTASSWPLSAGSGASIVATGSAETVSSNKAANTISFADRASAAAAAQVLPPRDPNDKRSDALVVDSGGFIKNAPLETLGREIYTIPEVIKEIRSKEVRDRLTGVLPYEIKFREPTPKSIAFVSAFAKHTGDFGGLSPVDLRVLALAHTLTLERSGSEGINELPEVSARTAPVGAGLKNGWYLPDFSKTPCKFFARGACNRGDNCKFSHATPAKPVKCEEAKKTDLVKNGQTGTEENKDDMKIAAALAAWGVAADEGVGEDDIGWISTSNLDKVTEALKKKQEAERAAVRVGCITTDFAMQNVLLAMGLKVVAVDGLLIQRVKTFALKCESCFRITHENTRLFCPHCGHNTLYKITVVSGENGDIRYRNGQRKTSTRGNVFSLPAPKGGRVNNIVLKEDQKEVWRPQPKKNDSIDYMKRDYVAGDSPFKYTDKKVNAVRGIGMRPGLGLQIGGGKNPNAVKKRTGNKKKK